MALSAWTRYSRTRQIRVQPTGWVPPEGSFVLVLGDDTPGNAKQTLKAGDYVEITQIGTFGVGRTLRMAARVRPPTVPLPGGLSWRASIRIDGAEVVGRTIPANRTRDLVDLGWNVAHLVDDHTVALRLQLLGTAGTYEVELPAFYVDALVLDPSVAQRPALLNRDPEPNETRVPVSSDISVDIVDVGPDGVSVPNTKIYVNGVLAFNAGTFQTGFTGTDSAYSTPSNDTLRVVIDPTATFTSQEPVTVRVTSQTVGGVFSLDQSYTFIAADIAAPTIATAMGTAQETVRVTFSEPVMQVSAAGVADALNPANYSIARLPGEASVSLYVTGVTSISDSIVDLTVNTEQSGGATYTVTAVNVTDLVGNAITAPNNEASFFGYACPAPLARAFDLYGMLPILNQDEDDTEDLRKFISIFQEITGLLLCDIDDFTDLVDPDIAPEPFVDQMLIDLGNPFAFDLQLIDKRRLVRILIGIYQQKGIAVGIINTIRFFMGIEVILDGSFGFGTASLGDATLDLDFVLGSSDVHNLLSFTITSPVILTATQLKQMTDIIVFMQRAEEHLAAIIQPAPVPATPDHLELGLSQLDLNWQLH